VGIGKWSRKFFTDCKDRLDVVGNGEAIAPGGLLYMLADFACAPRFDLG